MATTWNWGQSQPDNFMALVLISENYITSPVCVGSGEGSLCVKCLLSFFTKGIKKGREIVTFFSVRSHNFPNLESSP